MQFSEYKILVDAPIKYETAADFAAERKHRTGRYIRNRRKVLRRKQCY